MELKNVIAKRATKTVYRDGDACIKVFDKSFSKADVLNEALNQARVEETGLNIPHVREVAMIDGKWAIVSDFIEGKTLAALMDEDPDHKSEYLERFVDLQVEVLSQECPLLNKLKDKMNRKIDQTTLDATTRYELHTRLEGMPKHKKLCHGDFNPSNIIITPAGKAYIIDWSHATQGTVPPTRRERTFCSASKATKRRQTNTSTSFARKRTPQNSTFKSGCPSSPLRSRLRATLTSANSFSAGWTSWITSRRKPKFNSEKPSPQRKVFFVYRVFSANSFSGDRNNGLRTSLRPYGIKPGCRRIKNPTVRIKQGVQDCLFNVKTNSRRAYYLSEVCFRRFYSVERLFLCGVIAAWRKRLSFVAGKFHFNSLRVIAEIFSEQVKPALISCVVLDSDRQLNGRALQKIQIVERNVGVKKLIVEKNALFIHDDVFQNSELRGGYRPEFGGVFAAPSAEIAGGSERENFFFIYKDGYIARPRVVVAVSFRTDFERKHDFREFAT